MKAKREHEKYEKLGWDTDHDSYGADERHRMGERHRKRDEFINQAMNGPRDEDEDAADEMRHHLSRNHDLLSRIDAARKLRSVIQDSRMVRREQSRDGEERERLEVAEEKARAAQAKYEERYEREKVEERREEEEEEKLKAEDSNEGWFRPGVEPDADTPFVGPKHPTDGSMKPGFSIEHERLDRMAKRSMQNAINGPQLYDYDKNTVKDGGGLQLWKEEKEEEKEEEEKEQEKDDVKKEEKKIEKKIEDKDKRTESIQTQIRAYIPIWILTAALCLSCCCGLCLFYYNNASPKVYTEYGPLRDNDRPTAYARGRGGHWTAGSNI